MDVYIRRLRRKIEAHPKDRDLIRTVRGIGYTFTEKITAGTTHQGARPPSVIGSHDYDQIVVMAGYSPRD